jgi:uncharacterized SAM-binding protein YcdF (DUF218 family)
MRPTPSEAPSFCSQFPALATKIRMNRKFRKRQSLRFVCCFVRLFVFTHRFLRCFTWNMRRCTRNCLATTKKLMQGGWPHFVFKNNDAMFANLHLLVVRCSYPSIAQLVERWTVVAALKAVIHRSLVQIRLEGIFFL